MAAKKKRKTAAPRKPKKRAGRASEKKKARAKPNVGPAADLPTRNAALLSTLGAVEPPVPLTATSLVTSSPSIGSPELHAEMVEQIKALDRAIDDLREQRHGIGHNRPPEPIETAPPLSEKELGEIQEDIAVLRKQPPAVYPPSTEAVAAVSRLSKISRAVVAYVGKQADNFVSSATNEAGKRAIQSPFWLAIIHQLPALADIAHQWLQSLGPH